MTAMTMSEYGFLDENMHNHFLEIDGGLYGK